MQNKKIHTSIFSILLPIGLLIIFISSLWQPLIETLEDTWHTPLPRAESAGDSKHKGGHVFGHIDSTNLKLLIQNNFDWITFVPFGGQEDIDSPAMNYYWGDRSRRLRRDSTWENKIELAHAAGFKVFLKPHIWLNAPSNGQWRSDIFPTTETNWKLWQKSYQEYILHYAKIAEKNKVELFCIGTELSRLTAEKSEFWEQLIREVRQVYKGKLTYAANWHNEYEKITFWEELDYIGIQAYFPLVENEYPTVKQISKGWRKHTPAIKSISKKYRRTVIFTELGYKSTANSAIAPWEWVNYSSDQQPAVSFETQANCYEAFFKTVWKKEWLAGVHIWQLRSDFGKTNRDRKIHLDFTPQGKPAELVIAKGFE